MSSYHFKKTPQKVKSVFTKNRKIMTDIPCPGTKEKLEELNRYEPSSMQGQMPIIWNKAYGYQVEDIRGNTWIDFTSTIFVTSTGHANDHVTGRVQEALEDKLLHTYAFASIPKLEYLKKLIQITPPQFEKAALFSAGTEACEAAVRLMRLNSKKIGKKRPGIISLTGNWHGQTMGSQLLSSNKKQGEWIGHDDPNVHHLDFPYEWELNGLSGEEFFYKKMDALVRKRHFNPDRDICGFMIESFQGWGAIFYPYDFIKTLEEYAHNRNILICFDEMQAGFGRTGKLFGFNHYDVDTDLVCVGKAMGSGFPLSGVLGRKDILELPEEGDMISTHSANPMACKAGLATLEEIKNKDLIKRSEEMGKIFLKHLNDLKDKFPNVISHVYGKGLLAALLFKAGGQKTIYWPVKFVKGVCKKDFL